MQFVFAIYSCKKYLDVKSNLLYKLLKNKLKDCIIYIIYGDETLSTDYEIIDDTYLVLKCGDLYDNLSQKTICLFRTIEKIHPDIQGVFKCDDDILPNINKLNQLFEFILQHSLKIPYLGYEINHIKDCYVHFGIHKYTNKKYKKPLLVHSGKYTAGPLYYIGMDSIRILNTMPILNEIMEDPVDYIYEDNMIGYLLSQHNITPFHYNTYYDNIQDYSQGCIQNIDNKVRTLYVHLHGGLGNQLFQVAAGFELAKKNNRFLVLVYRSGMMTHNTSVTEFFSTIFSEFNYIQWEEVNSSKVIHYQEDKCFDFYDNIIKQSDSDSDYYIHGYFQNKKYLDSYKTQLLYIFCNHRDLHMSISDKKDSFLTNSYFIHIRRGDYIGHPLYAFDMDAYLKCAISFLLERNPEENPHFYIFSNDITFCKTYSVLDMIEKTFIEDMNTLDSLYFMSMCRKGGICSNSTFSGWASILNNNPNKTVIVPKNWINFDYPYEIPFDYTVSF